MRRILENTSLLFSIAIILGLSFPALANPISHAITPLLMVAMCLSMMQIRFSKSDLKSNYKSSIAAFILNYVLLTGIVILLASYLIPDPDYFAGFVLAAAVPPAVAIVAYSYLLGGDMKTSLGGEVLGYSLALILTPLITLAFLGSAIDAFVILQMLGLLIILPLIISRILVRIPESRFSCSKSVINVCFFFVNYILIGLNQAALISEFFSLLPLFFIVIVRTFGTGFLIYFLAKRIGVKKDRAISYGLFSSYKNGGIAAAFALVLVSSSATMPAAIGSIMGIFLIISFIEVTKRF